MIRAIFFPDLSELREKRVAGGIHIGPPSVNGEVQVWYCCPCGCGHIAPITAGVRFKPSDSPSWTWNGSQTEATLTPSVNHVGHWHGWLTDGYWRAC